MADQVIEQSVQDRMEAFLMMEDTIEDEPIAEPEVVAEAAEETTEAETEETSQEETTEEEAPPRKLKLTHNGEEIEKDETEVIALAQQGFDYTQKTQKLAEERKYVETLTSTIKEQEKAFHEQVQIQSALIQEVAKLTAIDQQLSQYQNLNWQQLSDTDPVEAQKLFFTYNQLQVQRGQLVNELNTKKQGLTEAQKTARAKQVELGQKVLEKEIPGWNKDMARSIVESGREYGFNDEELSNLTDPRAVKLLHDAAKWREFQKTKPAVEKKVSTAKPTVKPGATNTNAPARAKDIEARQQLRKTGDQNLAAKLIERLL